MLEHTSWFNYLLPNFEELLAKFREALGLSYLNNVPIEIQYVIGFAFVALVLVFFMLLARTKIINIEKALIPDGKLTWRTFFEDMVEGTLNTMEGIMDRHTALYFLPLIGTCAFIIFFSNLIGLIPGFIPPTSNLNTTAAMAVTIFVTTHFYGIKKHGFIKYFGHFCGPLRSWNPLVILLMILMFCIEMISHLARPLSLSIRLMGNMFADHAVVGIFVGLIPVVVPVIPMALGVVVCIVQTAVFCILSTVYIGGAVAHEEH